MTMSTHSDHPTVLGPDAALAQVFAFFESDGYRDASAAWEDFNRTWNWAAPLTTAAPALDPRHKPVALRVEGGFRLSGLWRLPPHDVTAAWLALPLAGGEPQSGRATPMRGGPDLFVVPSKVLLGAVHGLTGADDDVAGPMFRLEAMHVAAGFVTYTTGMPLRAGDAPFLWTASAALALGAARRMTDMLAGPGADAVSHPLGGAVAAAAAAELAAVLQDERLSLEAALHYAPSARQGLPSADRESLVRLVRQKGDTVVQVVASAYEHALTGGRNGARHPLVSLVEASAPILQQARYAMELLPPNHRTSSRKADRDDRRISG
jgi:hypothetical protein